MSSVFTSIGNFLGGGKPKTPTQITAPTVQDKGQEDTKRKIGRASLIATSSQGVLQPANTVSGRLLGN